MQSFSGSVRGIAPAFALPASVSQAQRQTTGMDEHQVRRTRPADDCSAKRSRRPRESDPRSRSSSAAGVYGTRVQTLASRRLR
jgi:hypothetical protein